MYEMEMFQCISDPPEWLTSPNGCSSWKCLHNDGKDLDLLWRSYLVPIFCGGVQTSDGVSECWILGMRLRWGLDGGMWREFPAALFSQVLTPWKLNTPIRCQLKGLSDSQWLAFATASHSNVQDCVTQSDFIMVAFCLIVVWMETMWEESNRSDSYGQMCHKLPNTANTEITQTKNTQTHKTSATGKNPGTAKRCNHRNDLQKQKHPNPGNTCRRKMLPIRKNTQNPKTTAREKYCKFIQQNSSAPGHKGEPVL